jgi:hypothetical protein
MEHFKIIRGCSLRPRSLLAKRRSSAELAKNIYISISSTSIQASKTQTVENRPAVLAIVLRQRNYAKHEPMLADARIAKTLLGKEPQNASFIFIKELFIGQQ